MEAYWDDVLALICLLTLWLGYSFLAQHLAKSQPCLSSVMHLYRVDWVTRMLKRENRIADASVIANLERNVAFFASTTILVLAGLMTILRAPESGMLILMELPFADQFSREMWELKIFILLLIFVYAFFAFTWSLRQYNFANVILGSAPLENEKKGDVDKKSFAQRLASVLSMAATQFNYGLRAYYFGLATLSWIVSPWMFILATLFVVGVLYQREFHSSVLHEMMSCDRPDS